MANRENSGRVDGNLYENKSHRENGGMALMGMLCELAQT